MALITQADLEAKLKRSLSSEETTAFNTLNDYVQAVVEDIIGSSVESVTESTRYYDGGLQHLPIDPCTDITSVKYYDEDQTAVYTHDSSDYEKSPINKTLKTMIRYRHGRFDRGISNVGISAKFSINGDAATLAIVKQSMINVLANEVSNNDNVRRESIEGYTVEYWSDDSHKELNTIRGLFQRII